MSSQTIVAEDVVNAQPYKMKVEKLVCIKNNCLHSPTDLYITEPSKTYNLFLL